MYTLKRVLHQEILGMCVWCQCIKVKEINRSVKSRLHYQWVPVVLEYGNGEYVENDSVDVNN